MRVLLIARRPRSAVAAPPEVGRVRRLLARLREAFARLFGRRALAAAWLALAIAKMLFPATAESSLLARRIGVPGQLGSVLYWIAVLTELALAIGLFTSPKPIWPRTAFLAAGASLLGWLTLEPLRSHCICIGTAVRLGAGAKLGLILYLLVASYLGVFRTIERR